MPQHPPILKVVWTPSPHRFFAGQRRAPSPSKDVEPPSAVQKQSAPSTAQRSDSPLEAIAESSQFARTPRFAFGKSRSATQIQRSPSPPKPAVVQSFRASTRSTEQVEDGAGAREDDEMLDGEQVQALLTTNQDVEEAGPTRPWTNDLAFSPKRRRVGDDDVEIKLSPTRSTFKRPQTPASHLSRATPHFTQSQAAPTQASTAADLPTIHAPAFTRQSAAPQELIEPLPETFSPHKRGQKFIPGGMAATVQQWVIETGQTAVQSRKSRGYLKGEDYVLRVKIDEVIGDDHFTARGRLPTGETLNLCLAGDTRSDTNDSLSMGKVVGIRAPTWEQQLNGTTWTVGVDWKVLS